MNYLFAKHDTFLSYDTDCDGLENVNSTSEYHVSAKVGSTDVIGKALLLVDLFFV